VFILKIMERQSDVEKKYRGQKSVLQTKKYLKIQQHPNKPSAN
jgi:hypothetical protein